MNFEQDLISSMADAIANDIDKAILKSLSEAENIYISMEKEPWFYKNLLSSKDFGLVMWAKFMNEEELKTLKILYKKQYEYTKLSETPSYILNSLEWEKFDGTK